MFFTLLTAAFAATPLWLDAGSLQSPVFDGFARLHLEGSEHPSVRWLQPPTEVHTLGFPDPLLTDGLYDGRLQVDLAPGRWDVWVLQAVPHEDPERWAGVQRWGVRLQSAPAITHEAAPDWPSFLSSAQFAVAPRPRFIEGESAFDRQIAASHRWQRAEVEVAGDGLLVEPFGRAVQALVISPVEQRAETEVQLAVVDGLREAWWQRHYAPEADPLPPITAGPLAVQAIGHDLRPLDAPTRLDLLVHEPITLLWQVNGGDGPGTVEARAGAGLAVETLELSWLDSADHPSRARRPRPTVGWAGPGWLGGQGLPPVLAVRLQPTRPGTHNLRLRLRRGEETLDLRVQVRAHPVPVEPGTPTGLYVQLPPEAMLRGAPVEALFADHLRLLASYGLRALSLRYLYWDTGYPLAAPVDLSRFTSFARTWADLGGSHLVWADPKTALRGPAYHGHGPAIPAERVEVVRALLDAAATAPVPTWLHMYEEEAYDLAARGPRAERFVSELRELRPDTRLLAAAPTAHDWQVASSFDALTLTGDGADLAAAAALVRAAGASPWAYNLAPGRAGPLVAWAAGVDVHLQWHANPSASDPFNDLVVPTRWYHTVLGPDGAWHPTATLLALADGVYDARLLRTLESQLCPEPDPNDPRDPATRALLAATRESVLAARLTPASDGHLFADATWRRIREHARRLLRDWADTPPRAATNCRPEAARRPNPY